MSVPVGIEGIEKSFQGFDALRGVSLDIHAGELVALLGPSGSGKTTLLRVVAGLEQADAGRVLFGETDTRRLSLRERRIGLRLSALRPVQDDDGRRQCRVRAALAASRAAPHRKRDHAARR